MRRFARTLAGPLALGMVLALTLAQVAGAQPAPPTDPAALLVAWERVAFGSSQDIDAALALMTDDAVLTVLPPVPPPINRSVWAGKAEIREALQMNKQLRVSRENIGIPQVTGDKVTTTAMVTNSNLELWGVAPVEHTTEVVVEGGKIKSYTSTMAPSERGRVAAAAQAYQQAQSAQPSADPISVFVAYLRAVSAGDVEGALALFADDAVLTITPPPPGTSGQWVGKEAIRGQLVFGRENSVRSEPLGAPQVDGNKVTARAKVTNSFFLRWGVAPAQFTSEAVIENGKLKSFTNTMDQSERERVAAGAAAYEQARTGQQPAGMPRTGEEQRSTQLLLLAVVGLLAAAIGVSLRRYMRSKAG